MSMGLVFLPGTVYISPSLHI